MLRMSSSDRALTKPCITALRRLPDLNSCNCLSRYSGCCCDSLGSVTAAELPPAPWHLAHPALKLASPLARSGLVLTAPPQPKPGQPVRQQMLPARQPSARRRATSYRGFCIGCAQSPVILQCGSHASQGLALFPTTNKAP